MIALYNVGGSDQSSERSDKSRKMWLPKEQEGLQTSSATLAHFGSTAKCKWDSGSPGPPDRKFWNCPEDFELAGLHHSMG